MTWPLMGYLSRRGLDLRMWLSGQGMELTKLLAPDARMPLASLRALWGSAAAAIGDDDAIGTRVALQIDPLHGSSWSMPFSVLEHISVASATLRDAVDRQRPYLRLLRDGFTIAVEDWQEQRPLVRWDFANPAEPRALVEFQMAMGVILTRRTVRDRTAGPLEVWLTHPAPLDTTPYTTLYGVVPRFGAQQNAMVLHGPSIDAPLPTHDAALLKVSEYRAHKLLNQLPSIEDFRASVRQHIQAELPDGDTTASAVARKLGISARTLHRRLNAQGSTYQAQLDEVRYRLATRYLASRRYHLGEIAALVGFAQQSAFQRAFKTWAGQTPAEYQQQHVGEQPTSRPRARTA